MSFTAHLRSLNRSNQTVAHYLQSAKQFTRWLTRTGRIARNPLYTVTKPNPSAVPTSQSHTLVRSSITKNIDLARQCITAAFATRLDARKPHSRKIYFPLLGQFGMADMLRDDMQLARAIWLQREDGTVADVESDFLAVTNDADESLDFHALRHNCGDWLATKGVHPKTILTIMRHKTITLTIDTYGHLFPNAEAEAVDKLGDLLSQ